MRYKGYEVEPSAYALPRGLYAANLIIETALPAVESSFSFEALDYFFEPDHAIAYASRWARVWIDQRAKRAAQ
ncbi:hypothetical protein [Paraburkholderia tropica]|uniref:hypothetical protein n=1 Tax=Paraburkholderia tropica TaxID=92647 RepID=UPI002AB7BD82|nr:hypothetical protein [Paraburkholderia tropica]